MKLLQRLMPARMDASDYTIVADLDSIISDTIAFKFAGKAYEILPVDTESFMKMARSLDRIRNLLEKRKEGEDITDHQVTESYFSLFSPICPTLKRDVVEKMSVVQLHSLLQLFIRHLTGQELDIKKKQLSHPPGVIREPNSPQT